MRNARHSKLIYGNKIEKREVEEDGFSNFIGKKKLRYTTLNNETTPNINNQ